MENWPLITFPDYGLDEEYYIPQVRTEFEGNYVNTRRRTTRGICRWNLSWNFLPEAEYQTLKTFFNANQGDIFLWTHPVTEVEYQCRFSTDFLKNKINLNGYREVTCQIEEV